MWTVMKPFVRLEGLEVVRPTSADFEAVRVVNARRPAGCLYALGGGFLTLISGVAVISVAALWSRIGLQLVFILPHLLLVLFVLWMGLWMCARAAYLWHGHERWIVKASELQI